MRLTTEVYPPAYPECTLRDDVCTGILSVVQARNEARAALFEGKPELEVDLHCARAARLEGELLLVASRLWPDGSFEELRCVVERFHSELH